ncbi:hypothetical protein ACFP2T_37965 [Plantactinospora solaniradicis]|uniref:Ig-like domain-containing protein n=1 Tax=Plantactinospora solaniradicis TaxID=1723736 RepID=A0ABW1KJN2_9ACTN
MARRPRTGSARPSPTTARQKRASTIRAWLAGVLAAALTAALAGVLTGWFGAAGREIARTVDRDEIAPTVSASTVDPGPLTVAVQPLGLCGSEWVVPVGPAEFDTPMPMNIDMTKGWRDWTPAAGGANAAPHHVLIFVQGRSAAEVIITGLNVRVVKRSTPPPQATVLTADCADPGAFRSLEVDLDRTPPVVTPRYDAERAESMVDEVPSQQLTPIKFPYEVSLSDAEPFLITAQTRSCDCGWVAEVTWASEGKTGTTVVDDGGVPFRSISTARATGRCTVSFSGTRCQ